jgi:hypothetical protein
MWRYDVMRTKVTNEIVQIDNTFSNLYLANFLIPNIIFNVIIDCTKKIAINM